MENRRIEYSLSDFMSESNKDFVDVTVVFNDDVEWNFPDLNISYIYKYLNGFKASMPSNMFNTFKQADFIKYIYERPIFNT